MSALGLDLTKENFREGDDLTERLGVTRYPAEPSLADDKRLAAWPTALRGVKAPRESRLQSAPQLLEEMRGKAVAITYKVDGQSVTIAKHHDGSVTVCDQTNEHLVVDGQSPTDLYSHVLASGVIDRLPPGYCLQVELAGPGFRKNRAGFPVTRLFVINVFQRWSDDDDYEELSYKDARGFCRENRLTPPPNVLDGWCVPTEGESVGKYGIDWFVKQALSTEHTNKFPGEGIVVRPMEPCASKTLHGARLSFAVINPKFEVLS